MPKSIYPSYKQMKEEIDYDTLYKWIQIDNLSYREIMYKYHYQERLISRLAKEYKISYGKAKSIAHEKKFTKEEIEQIIELYIEGNSTRTIGKIFNLEHSTINKILRKNNIQIRNQYDTICYNSRRKYHNCKTTCSFDKKIKRTYRYIMEQHLGRTLTPEEAVHHIDFNRQNNDISNLFLFPTNKKHLLYHGYIKKFPYITPQEFMEKYESQIDWLYNYDTMYNLYIVQNISCNKISKMFPEISTRIPITNYLKETGIYYLRKPTVNQQG